MVALQLFFSKSLIGMAMRAAAQDPETARLMGIDIDRTIQYTFAISGAMGGAAGALLGPIIFASFNMGEIIGIKAFVAATLGGLGSVPGAMVGGLFLGVFESVGPTLFLDGLGIPAPYQLKDAIAFTMLVLILIFRPSGILGERLATKKA
jgi:branched-chain amino acid transport system permease protein